MTKLTWTTEARQVETEYAGLQILIFLQDTTSSFNLWSLCCPGCKNISTCNPAYCGSTCLATVARIQVCVYHDLNFELHTGHIVIDMENQNIGMLFISGVVMPGELVPTSGKARLAPLLF